MHTFSFDGDVQRRDVTCERCGDEHQIATAFVLDDGDAFAICYVEAHQRVGEAFVDASLGDFSVERGGRITFACRYGSVEGFEEPSMSLMKPVRPESELTGRLLSRDEALAHPRVQDFWALMDWLVWNEPDLHAVMHPPAPTE